MGHGFLEMKNTGAAIEVRGVKGEGDKGDIENEMSTTQQSTALPYRSKTPSVLHQAFLHVSAQPRLSTVFCNIPFYFYFHETQTSLIFPP
jgi:hypothetical protein